MVYVKWEEQGICKWWMLQRCWRGDGCKYMHPADWRRRWDEETQYQNSLQEEFGIAPLQNPYRAQEHAQGPAQASTAASVSANPSVTGQNAAVPFGKARPVADEEGTKDVPASASFDEKSIAAAASSIPSLSPSPPQHAGRSTSHSAASMGRPQNANKVPLGRPNRLLSCERRPRAHGPVIIRKRSHEDIAHDEVLDTDHSPRTNDFKRARQARQKLQYNDFPVMNEERQREVEVPSPPGAQQHPTGQVQPTAASYANLTSTSRAKPQSDYHLVSSPALHRGVASMGTKRMANGEVKHPPRSEIRVSARYLTQALIDKKLEPPTSELLGSVQERSMYEAREDNVRLQGVTWLDHVRRALELPVRTFATACVYYHRLRLAHPGLLHGTDPNVQATVADACAASLLTACKVEDTLKKSRDVLAAAYNLKAPAQEQLGTDDSVFDGPVKHVIVLERMVLEAGGFDFRSKQPHSLMVRIIKYLALPDGNEEERKAVSKVAFTILTDLYRTFAPLKQTAAAMAMAALELAAHLYASTTPNNTSAIRDALRGYDTGFFSLTREEVMETLLDLLDLYTHHTSATAIGPNYSLDDFLRIRLAMNKECTESNLPRHTTKPNITDQGAGPAANGSTSRVANGHPTPVSPPSPDPHSQQSALQPRPGHPDDPQQHQQSQPVQTTRFMLNPQRAADEQATVQKYFTEEWEEYEEEIEVPIPQQPARGGRGGGIHDGPLSRPTGPRAEIPSGPLRGRDERDRERERLRDREREIQREQARLRERERDRERRRYDDRGRGGRYEDNRDRGRFEDDRMRRDDRR